MINRKIENIDINDITALIENSIPEGKSIEYKRELNFGTDDEKRELIADISSFSNSEGGDIIYGISEVDSYPKEIIGISIKSRDEIESSLNNILRDCVVPRINGVKFHFITSESDKLVLIIRIPKSWNSPHMSIFKKSSRFYARNSNGKYMLDYTEIKNAFLSSDALGKRIEEFVYIQVGFIKRGRSRVQLMNSGKIIIHIVPVVSFESGFNIDLKEFYDSGYNLMSPLGSSSPSRRYNFHGILTETKHNHDLSSAYMQLFRNGIIQTVNSEYLLNDSETKIISPAYIEDMILVLMKNSLELYKLIGINPPYLLFLTISGVKDFVIQPNSVYGTISGKKIEYDTLRFPEIIVNDQDDSVLKFIKPWFDALWNALGYSESVSHRKRLGI